MEVRPGEQGNSQFGYVKAKGRDWPKVMYPNALTPVFSSH